MGLSTYDAGERCDTKEKLKKHIMSAKANKLRKAKEQYANDEISEEELEETMDELFEDGSEFLNSTEEEKSGRTVELRFRFKEFLQILLYLVVVGGALAAIIFTQGAAIGPIVLAIVGIIFVYVVAKTR